MNGYIIVIVTALILISILILTYEIYNLYIWFTAEKVEATIIESLTNNDSEVLQYIFELNIDGEP